MQALFGCSPQRFLARLRLSLAPGLLRRQNHIGTVSSLLGFKQASHFSREFHLRYGSSPSAFLRAEENGVSNPGMERCMEKFLDEFPAFFLGRVPVEKVWATTRALGRPLHRIRVAPQDRAELEKLARNRQTMPWQAHRARMLLAVSDSQSSLSRLAAKSGLSYQTVWSLCRRYEERGLQALNDAPRGGRSRRIGASPRPKQGSAIAN
jgi:hypothetical protein